MPEGVYEEGGHLAPEGHHVATLTANERAIGRAGLQAGAQSFLVGILQLRHHFSIISILAGCFTTFYSGWNGGGPAAIAWGWPILACLVLCIGLCLSELVSAYPTSGGIYWWASKLGGVKAGYYTGWLNLIGLLPSPPRSPTAVPPSWT